MEHTLITCEDLIITDWYAWNNLGLPEPFFFNITCQVQITNLGQVIYLEEVIPPGIDALNLPFKIIVFQKPGYWPSVLKVKQIRFTKKIESYKFQTATIFCNKNVINELNVDQIT